ncbi:MAG TPA: hypothetical protein VFD33_03625, partial [Bacillota bacterium]|nr:hypothetical protein [Bacillota bacterium]
ITGPNIKAYIITSLITGLFSLIFFSFKQRISFIVYLLALVAGFILMYVMFINGSEAWDDIVGVIYYFVCAFAGIILGLLIQLIVKLINRKS